MLQVGVGLESRIWHRINQRDYVTNTFNHPLESSVSNQADLIRQIRLILLSVDGCSVSCLSVHMSITERC